MSEIKYCNICKNFMNLYPDESGNTGLIWVCSVCKNKQKEESGDLELYNNDIKGTRDFKLYSLDPCLLRKYLKCSTCKKLTSCCVFNYDKYSMKNAYLCEECKTMYKN